MTAPPVQCSACGNLFEDAIAAMRHVCPTGPDDQTRLLEAAALVTKSVGAGRLWAIVLGTSPDKPTSGTNVACNCSLEKQLELWEMLARSVRDQIAQRAKFLAEQREKGGRHGV